MNELDLDLALTVPRPSAEEPRGEAERPLAALRGPVAPDLLRDELLCEIFRASASAYPHAIALATLERRFTYREVEAMAGKIAQGLVSRGVSPGDVVGLWMAR